MMQGGYVAALAAGNAPGPTRVRIRRPLRAGDGLRRVVDGDSCEVFRDDELVMRAEPARLHIVDPGPVDRDAVEHAAGRELPFDLPFPTCIGCGERDDALGFRIRPLPGAGRLIAVWTPSPEEALPGGLTPREHVWTVIDCITSWAVFVDPPGDGGSGAVTGNIAMDFRSDLRAGDTYYFQSWRERDDARSVFCGGAVHDADGNLVALADQELIRTDGWGMQIPISPLA
jgi:hypothetical protein